MTFDFKYLGYALAAVWMMVQMGLPVGVYGVHSLFEKHSRNIEIMQVRQDIEKTLRGEIPLDPTI